MNPWLRVFAPFAAGYYLSYLLRNVNAVIAPELARTLAISAADLGLLTAAYLLGFGAFQLPLGLLLDRYGPRRVEAILLLVTAAGCALFALGHGLTELALARGLIGLGVSACLMASFKAFSLWFPADRLASLNAAVMAAGALGAITATMPVGWALPLLGWRGVFAALAALAAIMAAVIFATPEKPLAASDDRLGQQLLALAGILRSRAFWRFAPQTAMLAGGFMALQGLWAMPWLMNFNGYGQEAAAFHLLLTSSAMLVGFLSVALFVNKLKRRGITPERILTVGLSAGVLATLLIVADGGPTQLLWFVLGLVFAVGNLAYALLCAYFPPHLSGRVTTALNLAAFAGAFALQWGIGAMVDAFMARGDAAKDAYRHAFIIVLALQAASHLWFRLSGKQRAVPSFPAP